MCALAYLPLTACIMHCSPCMELKYRYAVCSKSRRSLSSINFVSVYCVVLCFIRFSLVGFYIVIVLKCFRAVC